MENRRNPNRATLISRMDDIDDADVIEGGYDDSDEAAAYRKFTEEMKDSEQYAKINVYRQPESSGGRPGAKRLVYLFEVGLDEYEYSQLLNRIRDEYGSGAYRLHGRDPNGGLLFNRPVYVESQKKPEAEKRDGFDPTNIFNAFQNALADHQERTEQMLARLQQPQSGGQDQMLSSLAVAFGMMEKMAGMFGGIQPTKPTDALGDLKRLVEMKELMRGVFDGESGSSGKGLHDTLTETIKTFGPMIQAGMETMKAQQAPIMRRPARLAPPNPTAQTAQPQNQNERQAPRMNAQQVAQVNALLQNAKAGISPEKMADTILSMTPEAQQENLRTYIESPTVVEQMAAVNPEVNDHIQWFEKLRDALRLAFSDDDLQDDETGANLSASDASTESNSADARTDPSNA